MAAAASTCGRHCTVAGFCCSLCVGCTAHVSRDATYTQTEPTDCNLLACLPLGAQDAEATDTVLPVTYPQLHNMVEKGGVWEACRPQDV